LWYPSSQLDECVAFYLEDFDLSVKVEIGKALENLFQSGLTYRVVVDVEALFQLVDHAEHLSDRLLLV